MFQELRESIKGYFNAHATHAFYTGTAGKLAYNQAPPSFTLPYAVFGLQDFGAINAFRVSISEGVFGVNCYAATAEAADDLVAACRSMFDRNTLTVSGHDTVLPVFIEAFPALKAGEDEDEPFLAGIEFRIRIQH
jgi:hypothetical protein